jgi:hypothetical protein
MGIAAVLAAALLAPTPAPAAAAPAPPATDRATFTAAGSVRQAYVTGARRGDRLMLVRRGRIVARGTADRLGSRIFRRLAPGGGYTVRARRGGRVVGTRPFRVLSERRHPPRRFYRAKRLRPGLNYVTMRDGVELAMTVRLPPGKRLEDGPFPTVIEYSGYQAAAPKDLLSSIVASLSGSGGGGGADPLVPASSTFVGAVIAPMLGFATVSVQMRGSGCSGGAFDLFDLPTTLDGYDAVETVAAQPWVKGGRVGMVGISFSGITQLFTAGTRPPHLAAISPMSVTDDIYTATGYPGGIFNDGFALSWLKDRIADARPAPAGGQPWARALTRRGDRHCIRNQRLRLQTEDALRLVEENPFRTPALFDQRAPSAWMGRIEVPTFLVGQFQDEQTGGHFAESLGRLSGNRRVWITLQNGVHVDSLAPQVFTRWVEFLKLYVAGEVPVIPDSVLGLGGPLYRYLADADAAPLEQSRLAGMPSVAAARAAFERDPRVRLLMDNGGGPAGPGTIGAPWELGFGAWPPRQTAATSFALGPGGRLVRGAAAGGGRVSYTGDPRARPDRTLPGRSEADAWKAQPPYRWAPVAAGKGLGWISEPLGSDVVIAGPSSLDLRLRSTARDTDLQATISEVRPDGSEIYVQSGWLRASHRRLDRAASTRVRAVPTHLPRHRAPLTPGRTALVRVPIVPVAHAFRAGSRIRVTLTAPGGERSRWSFRTIERGRTRNTVELGRSALVLPVVRGATAQGTPPPAPGALRGQPARAYVPASNGG